MPMTITDKIKAAEELNKILDPDPSLPTDPEMDEKKLNDCLREAAMLLEETDTITHETDTVFKYIAVKSHKAKVLPRKESDAVGRKLDKYGFTEGSASGAVISKLMKGMTIEAMTKEIQKEFKKDARVAEGRVRIIIRVVKQRGFKLAEKDGVYKLS